MSDIFHYGFTVWLTGLPCSGKSTLAKRLASELLKLRVNVRVLDASEIRATLNRDLGFSKEDRFENIRRVRYLCKLLNKLRIVVVAAFVSPYREMREDLRSEIPNYVEVYVKCPVNLCSQRDGLGLYQKAFSGETANFTGVSAPYEEPLKPDVICKTDSLTPEQSVAKILAKLKELKLI